MVVFITGPAGSGKTMKMFSRIKDLSYNPESVCIIVPEQFSHDFDKKLYYYLGPERFNELFSLSFTGLSRQLFQIFGDPSRKGEYADTMAKMILIYQSIEAVTKSPESFLFFKKQSDQNGFAEETLKLICDLKRSGTTPSELMEKTRLLDKRISDKAADSSRLFAEYERFMKTYGFKDELDNIREAAKIANLNRYFDGKNVFIDEFESFTADQFEMLKIMISSADNVFITLRTDDVNAKEFTLFETVNDTFRKIKRICRENNKSIRIEKCQNIYRFSSDDLCFVSKYALRNDTKELKDVPAAENIHIFEAKDMYTEAEYVCASIKHLIYENKNLRFKDISIISNDIARYEEIIKAAFKRYEIPYFLSIEKPVGHTVIMVYITSLLDILNNHKYSSDQIFRLLKTGLSEVNFTDISLLENYCYKWNVDGNMWVKPFTAADQNIEKIELIRKKVIKHLFSLKNKAKKAGSASELCTIIYDHLISSGVERNISKMMGELIKNDKDNDAAELKRLWGCLIDILDCISQTLSTQMISFNDFSRMIRSMIGQINYLSPPQTLDAVMTASARTARLDSPKVVFIMGANDGDFPNTVKIHGLISESDRAKLAERGIELSTPLSELIAAERLVVYKSLSAASDKLYLTYPLSDLSGLAKYPAPIIDKLKSLFNGQKIVISDEEVPPHYYAVTLHSAFYHYMQERKAALSSVASLKELLLESPEYRKRLEYVFDRSRKDNNFHIDRTIMEKLQSFDPLKLSSTGLDEYNRCHFSYFCDKCLRLKANEKIRLDARVAGELAHHCFLNIISSRSKNEFIRMSYYDLKEEVTEYAKKYRCEVLAGDYGKDGKFDLIYNKIIERMPEAFLHTQHALMHSDFIPHSFELELKGNHSLKLTFSEDKILNFNGIVDRADICSISDEKYLRIVDYKSSVKEITAETLACGINMQMLLYLFSATDKGGIYEGYKPAGVLYSPIRINEIALEDAKIEKINNSVLQSAFKTNGLILDRKSVLEAMEKDIKGDYIPVSLDKNGVPDKYSKCISEKGMELLREYTFSCLQEMGRSLLEGNIEAIPLVFNSETPCMYCKFSNLCGNNDMKRIRTPESSKVEITQKILGTVSENKEVKIDELDRTTE